jgi:hypothetical protein
VYLVICEILIYGGIFMANRDRTNWGKLLYEYIRKRSQYNDLITAMEAKIEEEVQLWEYPEIFSNILASNVREELEGEGLIDEAFWQNPIVKAYQNDGPRGLKALTSRDKEMLLNNLIGYKLLLMHKELGLYHEASAEPENSGFQIYRRKI